MTGDNLLTLRFSLDKTLLCDPSAIDHPIIIYEGPENFQDLKCRSCKSEIVSGSLRIKGSPSENWREVSILRINNEFR
jgi:hypothetical protein